MGLAEIIFCYYLLAGTIEITNGCQTRSSFGSDLQRSGLNGLFFVRKERRRTQEKTYSRSIRISETASHHQGNGTSYFYGTQADQYSFYRIPKALFQNDYFKILSSDAKILYGLMLDRMSLSIKNQWFDERNRAYIYFSIEDIMELLNCGRNKAVKFLQELDDENGIGLIKKKRQGFGKALNMGADVVGGIPWIEYTKENEQEHIDQMCKLAEKYNKDISMLLDDVGDAEERTLEMLCKKVIEMGWQGRVTAQHCRAMSLYSENYFRKLVQLANDAGIGFVTNPHTGPLHLRVKDLLRAGIPVALGQDDNIQRYGRTI